MSPDASPVGRSPGCALGWWIPECLPLRGRFTALASPTMLAGQTGRDALAVVIDGSAGLVGAISRASVPYTPEAPSLPAP